MGYGSECVAATIPENIWKYIQDECDSDVDDYIDKLNDDEIPEEFRLAESFVEFYEVDNQFFNKYSAYSTSGFEVTDENNKIVCNGEISELTHSTEYCSAPSDKPYLIWESVEKGSWYATIETDKPFDISKLKLIFERLCYENDERYLEFVSRVEYDGEEYYIELNSTTGKAYELDFYDDRDENNED